MHACLSRGTDRHMPAGGCGSSIIRELFLAAIALGALGDFAVGLDVTRLHSMRFEI